MSVVDIIEQRLLENPRILELSDEEVDSLTESEMASLQEAYGHSTFMTLPPREQRFMEWLKENDSAVWEDLWEGDDEQLVSLAFLPMFRKGGSGFLICELAEQDNFFFTSRHVRPEGLSAMKSIIRKAEQGKELSVGEVLMIDILASPMDIWHFCFKYGIPLSRGKNEVDLLESHQWLVHLRTSEELAPYLDQE